MDFQNNRDEGGVRLDPRMENARLQKLFDTARADQQANYPDLYVSTGAAAAKDSKDLTKALGDAKVQSEMMAKIEVLIATLAEKVDVQAVDAIESVTKAKL